MASPSVARPLKRPRANKKNEPTDPTKTPVQGKIQSTLKRWLTPTSADKEDHSAKKARIAEPIAEPVEEPRPQRRVSTTYSRRKSVLEEPAREALFARAAIKEKTPSPVKQVKTESVSRKKAANGLKHELERLQPAPADVVVKKDEKRKLRSQEGAKHKSELSNYFPEYDLVIGNEVAEKNVLDFETPILITNSDPSLPKPRRKTPSPVKRQRQMDNRKDEPQPAFRHFGPELFTNLHNVTRIELELPDDYPLRGADPLPDSLYTVPHKRAERLEKSIRNAEKLKAQHDRNQVERLLEGLESHDWLKILGVTAVTESKRHEYEPARDYFIKGCRGILERFRLWKEEEKQRKLDKERKARGESLTYSHRGFDGANDSDGDPPDYDDTAAANQLHQEAMKSASKNLPNPQPRIRFRVRRPSAIAAEVERPKTPEKPFKSFYEKPHLREAALDKRRRRGRTSLAFGLPIPEPVEREFGIPEVWQEDAGKRRSPRKRRSDL